MAMMDAAKSLDTASLEKYRPYFEARQERDKIQRFIAIRMMKVAAEELDLEAEAAKRAQQ